MILNVRFSAVTVKILVCSSILSGIFMYFFAVGFQLKGQKNKRGHANDEYSRVGTKQTALISSSADSDVHKHFHPLLQRRIMIIIM